MRRSRGLQPGLIQFALSADPRTQLQLDLEYYDFPNSLGMLYFREFVSLVQGPWITGQSVQGNLWKVTMPQLARTNPALRHAAMALGAISMWYSHTRRRIGRVALPSPHSAPNNDQAYYLHALLYYGQSLKLHSRRASLQNAVLLAILLLVFETLRGHRRAALDHVNHGMALLLSLLIGGDTSRNGGNFAPDPNPLFAAVADIFTQLAMQTRTVVRGRVGSCLPLPNLASGLREKNLTVESFVVLLSQLSRSANLDYVPPVFHTLDEFEEYMVALRRKQAAIGPTMREVLQTSGILDSEDEASLSRLFPRLLGNPQVRDAYEKFRKTIRAMDTAFLPLFDRITLSGSDSPLYLRAVHLRLQFLAAYIFDNPPQYLDISAMHALTPHFREFLSLAEIALRAARRETTNPAHQVSMEGGLAWHLLLVSLYCRSPPARDEAMWLLKDHIGQDGLWSTQSLYILALRNRALERTNATEDPPATQWQRLLRREYLLEDGGDRILFRFLDKDDVTGEWRLVEEVAEIGGYSDRVEWERQAPASGKLLIAEVIPC